MRQSRGQTGKYFAGGVNPHNENVFGVLIETFGTLNLNIIVCVEVLRPSQPNGVMSSAVSLPNHTFTGQA